MHKQAVHIQTLTQKNSINIKLLPENTENRKAMVKVLVMSKQKSKNIK